MYKILKTVIETKRYELIDMLGKLDTLWAQGSITDVQRLELIELARKNAAPEATYAPLQEQVDALAERLDALTARVAAIEAGTPSEPPAEPEEWPEFVQPTGAHDAYNVGDKITYTCIQRRGSYRKNLTVRNRRLWTHDFRYFALSGQHRLG